MYYTLAEMQAMEKEGKGRIYWYYEDRTYSSTPQPIWIPSNLVPAIFGR